MTRVDVGNRAGWAWRRVKHGFKLIGSGTTPPSADGSYYGGLIPWVTSSEIRENRIGSSVQAVTEEALAEFSALKLYQPNTVLVAMYGATMGRIALLGIPATTNQAVCALAEPTHFDPRFAFYALQASQQQLISEAVGGGQPNLSAEKVRELSLPCPDLDRQRAIAAYLDGETTRLDGLIAAKERLLGLLAEKRHALVTRAVTRGIAPRVALRDSGIPWLGPIPTHWDTVALRFLVEFISGATPDTGNPEYWDGEIPWVSPKDMKRDAIADAEDHVNDAALADSALRIVPVGAVLVVVRGMILAHSFPVALTLRDVTINQDMKALVCRSSLHSRYLRAFLHGVARYVVSLADASAHGTRKLETDILGQLQVCVPPIREQDAISEYIAAGTAKLDRLSVLLTNTIALLKERRSALIAAAVTGQIDVETAA